MKTSTKTLAGVVLALLLAAAAQPAAAAGPRCYVYESAAGANDGTSWADAFTDLQGALGDPGCNEIWVAAGTYSPGAARGDSFQLSDGQDIYGGFNGTETAFAQRDWLVNSSVLSGDVNGNDGGVGVNYADNNYHVVYANNVTGAALDGFTIRGGAADGTIFDDQVGGGMIVGGGNLTVSNVLFVQNVAIGGGAFYSSNSTFTFTNVGFYLNQAQAGAGMAIDSGNATIANAIFEENSAITGAGIYGGLGTISLSNVTFFNNDAQGGDGGGMGILSASLNLTNVTFHENNATGDGGAMHLDDTDLTDMNHLTIHNNTANTGNGIYTDGTTNGVISNSIFWNNSGDDVDHGGGSLTINDSIIQGGCPAGVTCFNMDTQNPQFGPFQANGGFGETLEPLSGSPAVDTAGQTLPCAAKDQRGVVRPHGGGCDMGAVEVDNFDPDVASTNVLSHYSSGPLMLMVTFSEDMNDILASHGGNDDVTNPDNYFLVEAGLNVLIDTISCQGGLEPDDSQIGITSVSYNSATFRSTLTLASALPEGSYRLYICGSTSNRDVALNLLNAGVDVTVDFTVGAGAAAAAAAAGPNNLPDTGFAPGGVNVLAAQSEEQAYAASDLILNIPSLNVELDIVGVPLVDKNWDVTWLAPSQAGYLQGTAWPTWAGNSAISAHVWNADNSAGPFHGLKNLQHGDQFTIVAWGRTYTYEVRTNRLVSDHNLSVLRDSAYSLITLITCEGFNDLTGEYIYRRAVQAVLISID